MKKRKQSQEPGPSAPASRIPMQSVDFLEIASTTWLEQPGNQNRPEFVFNELRQDLPTVFKSVVICQGLHVIVQVSGPESVIRGQQRPVQPSTIATVLR